MTSNKKIIRSLAIFLFLLGMLFAMALAGVAAWTGLEATFYGFERLTNERLTTLRCPVLMTVTETGAISATVSNLSDVTVEPKMRIYVSGPGPFRTVDSQITLAPGETQQVHWTVTSEDVDYKDLIMVKVLAFPYYKFSTREGTCGILVLNLPNLTGSQVFDFALVVALSGLLIGMGLWIASGPQYKKRILDATRAMIFLAILTLVDLFVSFRGAWFFGLVLFLATVLLIVVVLAIAVRGE